MKSKLRILFTTSGYKPAYRMGGLIIAVSSVAEGLVRKGHSVTVFTTNCNQSEELDVPVDCPQMIEGVEVWYFRRLELLKKMMHFVPDLSNSIGYLYAPAMANQLKKTISSMDLVHTHLTFIYPTYAAAHAAKVHNKPLFYSQHGVLDPTHLSFHSFKKRLYIRIVEQPILKSATTLIALTEAEEDSYRTLCPSVPCRIIPNGIDVNQHYSKPDNPNILNIHPEAIVILFLGRLHPVKGADKLLKAFFNVCTQVSDAILVMAGPDEFNLENQFQTMVGQSGLQNRIIFPGMVTGETKKNLLARADLFCLPSGAEGFSIAILEALASGTPVMISPGCHFPEVEKTGVGRVVEAEPKAMAKAMIELFKDRKKLEEMGRRGREFVIQNYSMDTIVDQLIEVYDEGMTRYASETRK